MAGINSKSIFQFTSKSDIIKIICFTGLVFVVLHFIRITLLISNESTVFFYEKIWNPICLPGSFKQLLYRPWSIVTYMFLDISFFGLLGNMIWLWVFGTVIEDLLGQYRVLPIYLVAGIIGGIFLVAVNSFFPSHALTNFCGAEAAVFGIAFAALIYKPKFRFWMFFNVGIPIWVFVLIFIVLRTVGLSSGNLNLIALLAGGAAVGSLYTSVLSNFFEHATYYFKKWSSYVSNNENFVLKQNKPKRAAHEVPFRVVKSSSKRLDDILDKINEKGMDSLTTEEKKLLEDYSKIND